MRIKTIITNKNHWTTQWIPISYKNILSNNQMKKYKANYSKLVGDGKRAMCVVIPIAKLFENDTTSIETDESDDWGRDVETD